MTVAAGALLTQGLRREFARVYSRNYDGVVAELADIMWLDATSDKIKEVYGYLESAPHPVRWDRGNVIESAGMNSVQFTVVNRDWGRRIRWHVNDRADDQTGTLIDQARDLGRNWAILPERVLYQIITNTTDSTLLPAIPNAADGNALYISSTRFGVSGGNQVATAGTSTMQEFITDIMNAYRRFLDFRDTTASAQPLWNDRDVRRMKVLFGTADTLVANQALTAVSGPWKIAGTSTTDVSVAAEMPNVVRTAGLDVVGLNSTRISDNSRYFFIRDLPNYKRPIFRQIREPFFETFATWDNSDRVRDTGEEYIQFKSREGYGIPVPYATVKVA